MKYWRISNDNTNVFWQYSADKVTWTTLRTDTVPYAMTTMYFRLEAGHYSTEPSPGIGHVRQFAFEGLWRRADVRSFDRLPRAVHRPDDRARHRRAFPSCTGFTGGTTVYSAPVRRSHARQTDYGVGWARWMPTSPPETRSYRITTTVQNNASAAGLTATGRFTWESQCRTLISPASARPAAAAAGCPTSVAPRALSDMTNASTCATAVYISAGISWPISHAL